MDFARWDGKVGNLRSDDYDMYYQTRMGSSKYMYLQLHAGHFSRSGMVPIGCILQGQVRYLHVTQAHCDRIHEPWRDIFVAGRPILFSHDPYLAGWLPCLASRSQFF